VSEVVEETVEATDDVAVEATDDVAAGADEPEDESSSQ
jgi:hypothetical protein